MELWPVVLLDLELELELWKDTLFSF